jgi:hypothetical protein
MATNPARPKALPEPIPLHRVLVEEFNHQHPGNPLDLAAIEQRRAHWEAHFAAAEPLLAAGDRELAIESALVGEFHRQLHRESQRSGIERTALCFSGGGIRSATFGLGILQGLARLGLLKRFAFLSTVSGGGYLGSWLSGWIQREGGDVAKVEAQLAGAPLTPLEPDPETIHHLRQYSRYMSPRFGLLSADTWTLVATFFRNLFLNWLVLLPLLAAGLMLPRIGVVLARRPPLDERVQWSVFWFGVAAGILAIAYISANRPSLTLGSSRQPPKSSFPLRLQTQTWFLWLCLLPLGLMALAVTIFWAWTEPSAIDRLRFQILGFPVPVWLAFVLFGVLLHLGGFALSRWFVRALRLSELAVVVVSGGLGGLLAWLAAWLAATKLAITVHSELGLEIYVCVAAPVLLLLFLLATTSFVGLTSKYTSDGDREWLARCGAWVLIAILGRATLSAVVIFGPLLWHLAGSRLMAAVGGVSGLVTLVLGFAPKTEAAPRQRGEPQPASAKAASFALTLAAPLFVLSILVGLSALTSLLLRFLAHLAGRGWTAGPALPQHGLLDVIAHAPGWFVIGLAAGLVVLGGVAGYFVDINRFSLHAAYRDRLIRAYLGASRRPGTRRPNPFTGFDDNDNLEMVELKENPLFHVVNVTLNLVHGQDLALQDRKAESFTFSALHCGYHGGYRTAAEYGRHKDGKKVSLGTAVAISGAAASPNMGSHSSPVITFLLALFNIRLGWWLGNPGPAGGRTFSTQGPRFAPAALLSEAFGLTDDTKGYVYLSDGGHFENLGLYEMVLRRCRYIVVSDGGQDGDFTFGDLGNAISKIRIDLGVPIEFDRLPMRPRPELRGKTYDSSKAKFPYFAVARIRYSCVDYLEQPGDLGEAIDGLLLYVKLSLNGTEPADVFNYAKLHPTFPHESTGNQLYSEAQFESYRALGSHVVDTISNIPPDSVRQLLAWAQQAGAKPQSRAMKSPGAAADSAQGLAAWTPPP